MRQGLTSRLRREPNPGQQLLTWVKEQSTGIQDRREEASLPNAGGQDVSSTPTFHIRVTTCRKIEQDHISRKTQLLKTTKKIWALRPTTPVSTAQVWRSCRGLHGAFEPPPLLRHGAAPGRGPFRHGRRLTVPARRAGQMAAEGAPAGLGRRLARAVAAAAAYPKPPGVVPEYGTAGFRAAASTLPSTVFRCEPLERTTPPWLDQEVLQGLTALHHNFASLRRYIDPCALNSCSDTSSLAVWRDCPSRRLWAHSGLRRSCAECYAGVAC